MIDKLGQKIKIGDVVVTCTLKNKRAVMTASVVVQEVGGLPFLKRLSDWYSLGKRPAENVVVIDKSKITKPKYLDMLIKYGFQKNQEV